MNYPTPSSRREILDQDLQIVRVTLAAISDDVRVFSGPAADAIQEALKKLDCAQEELTPPGQRDGSGRPPLYLNSVSRQ